MRLARSLLAGTVMLWLTAPSAAAAQQIQLEDTHYYDCMVTQAGADVATTQFDIIHIARGENRASQVNLFDPQNIVMPIEGWLPENIFLLPRSVSPHEFFLVSREIEPAAGHQIETMLEVSPDPESDGETVLKITRIVESDNEGTSVVRYSGPCRLLTGEQALEAYETGSGQ